MSQTQQLTSAVVLWTVDLCDASCCLVDVDECESKTHHCEAPGAQCHNLDGSYECVCHPGYQLRLDGLSCIGNSKDLQS